MRAILLLAALLMAASPVLAQNWDETEDGGGDAGDLPGSAQAVGAGPYTSITGEIDSSSDVDMYQIVITDAAAFSATACNAFTAAGTIDPAIQLFAADGSGIYENDDTEGGCGFGGLLSTLPAGHAFSPTEDGAVYYLSVSGWQNDPLDSSLAFVFDQCGFSTVCGPAGVGPVDSWDSASASSGVYQIDLTGGVVPVELVSFTGAANGTDVTLNWETASETNNAGFEVQMLDGETWNALGFVNGHGTTTEAQTYSFTAGDIPIGTHVFRLKQIDFDGVFEYSGEVEVTVETPGTHLISSAYPNPFNPQSQFTLAVAQEQHVTAELYNTLGQRIAVLFEGTVEANQPQLVTIDGAGLSSGMYIVRVNGENFSDALSVTLLK
ncbi:MAG: T9SS type A sorting domain-containing protein [Bacteroidetes bacterium]|nr:T9SS type A sorting domain-containing protein [Bacteroidota bacterium]